MTTRQGHRLQRAHYSEHPKPCFFAVIMCYIRHEAAVPDHELGWVTTSLFTELYTMLRILTVEVE